MKSLRNLWDTIKHASNPIMGPSEGKEKKKRAKRIFDTQWPKLPKFEEKLTYILRNTTNSK